MLIAHLNPSFGRRERERVEDACLLVRIIFQDIVPMGFFLPPFYRENKLELSLART
jgi:hypothetical protein